MKTYRIHTGELVTSHDGEWPTQYTNRTQANKAAARIPGAEVIQRGRPFYVRIPEPEKAADAPPERAANREWFVRCACSPGVIAFCGPEPVTCPCCQNTEIDTWPQSGPSLYILDGNEDESFTRDQLMAANDEDPHLAWGLDSLDVGKEWQYGGGAAATFTIRRVQ